MFTGIIEETGRAKRCGDTLEVTCKTVLNGTKIGDSIAVNGCCQTVVELSENSFTTRVSGETLKVAAFNESVNLERAMPSTGRLGGHFVTGHVDCTGKCVKKIQYGDFWELSYEIPDEFSKYLVKKGSIAVNGVSLTIASVQDNIFTVAVIPHTWENTFLDGIVNIETDILGKYVEKFTCVRDNKITTEFLAENGFV